MTFRGIEQATVDRFRLGYEPGSDRLLIPYLTPQGAWHVKKRCLHRESCKDIDGHSKYIYEPGIEPHLFNAQTLIDADSVVITEGELDAIACEQAGVPAVAYPGTGSWKPHWSYCFDSTDDTVVLSDGDDAGRKAAARVAKSLRAAVQGDVRVVEMPPGEDASSFISARGAGEFMLLIGWIEEN